jgi:glycosyltransferase involved in cell wall biosynthesis
MHYDLPVCMERENNPPGTVSYFKTLLTVFFICIKIPSVSKVVVFGSRNFCFSYGLVLLLVSKLFGKKFYVRFFGGHPTDALTKLNPFIASILFKCISLADKIIVETHVGASKFPKYVQNKISVVVGYREDSNYRIDKKKDGNVENTVKFVYAGDISKGKGVDYLLDAFNSIRNGQSEKVELHLYGAGNKTLIKSCLNIDRVYYHGLVSNSELCKKLCNYNVFVFPSIHKSEGHPGSVIEALMSGLPVIASNLAGISEVITHNFNGILFEPGNVKQLVEAMERLVNDDKLSNKLGRQALVSSLNFNAKYVLPLLADALDIEN